MKQPLFQSIILSCLFMVALCSYERTYGQMPSKSEEAAQQRINRRWARAVAISTSAYLKESIDTLRSFLVQYPHSLYKFEVLAYEFDLMLVTSHDSVGIEKIANDLLQVDSSAVNQNWVGQRLVSHSMSSDKGKALIDKSLPFVVTDQMRYNSHETLAQYHISRGDFVSARSELEQALAIDSTQFEPWIDFMGIARFTEDENLRARIQSKLMQLKSGELKAYEESNTLSPNLFKQVSASDFLDIRGKELQSGVTAKKVTVLNYFSFYCASCIPELGDLKKLEKKYPAVSFLFVNIDPDSEAATFPYMKKPELRFLKGTNILMEGPRVQKLLRVQGVPQIFILDQSGIVRYDHLGYIKGAEKELEKNIVTLLRK